MGQTDTFTDGEGIKKRKIQSEREKDRESAHESD